MKSCKILFLLFFSILFLLSTPTCAALPDLSVSSSEIVFSNDAAEKNEVIFISATVRNNGSKYVDDIPTYTYDVLEGDAELPVYRNLWIAQYFVPAHNYYLGNLSLYLYNCGVTTDSITVEIRAHYGAGSDFEPAVFGSSSLLTSKTLVSTFTAYGWQEFVFDDSPQLLKGVTYWICAENYASTSGDGYLIFDDTSPIKDMLTASNSQGQSWSGASGNHTLFHRIYKTTGTVVSCYNGDPGADGTVIGSTILPTPITASGSSTLGFQWKAVQGDNDIFWKVSVEKSTATISTASRSISVIAPAATAVSSSALPELSVAASDVAFSNPSPEKGEAITISATIHNSGGIYVNDTPVTSHNTSAGSVTFAPVYAGSAYGQCFSPESDYYIGRARLLLRNMGSTGDPVTLEIRKNKSGEFKPDTNSDALLVSNTAVSTSTSYGWVDFNFDTFPRLSAGATYWMCVKSTATGVLNGYRWLIDTGTVTNTMVTSADQGQNWALTSVNANAYYRVYRTTDTLIQCFSGDPQTNGTLIGSQTIQTPVGSGKSTTVSFNWITLYGSNDIYISIDPAQKIQESLKANNTAYKTIAVALSYPTIVGDVTPRDHAIGVGITEPVRFTLSEDMDSDTVTRALSVCVVQDNNGTFPANMLVSGTTIYANKVVTFTAPWKKGYTYRVTVSTGAKDLFGNNMQNARTWVFTTVMDYNADNSIVYDNQTKITLPAGTINEDYYVVNDTNVPSQSSLYAKVIQATNKIKTTKGSFSSPLTASLQKLTVFDSAQNEFGGEFQNAISLTIPYSEAVGGYVQDSSGLLVKESTLSVYRLNETDSLWVKIPNSEVHTLANTVTAQVSHFSVFAILGGSDTDLTGAYAYPVPWKPFAGDAATGSLAGGITFTALGSEATIRIYTLSGELVRVLEYQYSGSSEQKVWDGKNAHGELVASGVYIYYIENPREHKTGKLIVIK